MWNSLSDPTFAEKIFGDWPPHLVPRALYNFQLSFQHSPFFLLAIDFEFLFYLISLIFTFYTQ